MKSSVSETTIEFVFALGPFLPGEDEGLRDPARAFNSVCGNDTLEGRLAGLAMRSDEPEGDGPLFGRCIDCSLITA